MLTICKLNDTIRTNVRCRIHKEENRENAGMREETLNSLSELIEQMDKKEFEAFLEQVAELLPYKSKEKIVERV